MLKRITNESKKKGTFAVVNVLVRFPLFSFLTEEHRREWSLPSSFALLEALPCRAEATFSTVQPPL